MAIEKINFSYPKGSLQSVFDNEALTALELAAKTSKKVDECVEIVNGVEQTAIEATAIVDDMYVIQNQFVTDNSDTRAQLVNDNQMFIDGLTASKTEFENTMTEAVNNIVENSNEIIQNDVSTKLNVMAIDGTLSNIINEELLTEINNSVSKNEFVVSEIMPNMANLWGQVVGETAIDIDEEQIIFEEI